VVVPVPSRGEPASMSRPTKTKSSECYNGRQESGPDRTDRQFVPVVHDNDNANELEYEDASEYDEVSILDDEIYEITYYEDETVLDDSQHNREMQQFAPSSAPPLPSPQIRLVGMDMLMANIRTRVPIVE
jgi:hypothetical protein